MGIQMKNQKKRKLTKAGRILTDIILVVALCVAGYSGYKVWSGLSTYHESDKTYQDLKKYTASSESESTDGSQVEEDTFQVDHASLSAVNSDYVGWIRMKNSYIDYPMVQGTDNEYYLDHLYTKEYNYVGSVFLDCNSARDFSDKNTVIYAHNVKNGTMFMEIAKFEDPSYYADHNVIELYTPDADYLAYPVAGILTTGSDDYVSYNFASNEEFMNYVNRFKNNSTFTSDTDISEEDQTVLFSTCSYSLNDGRYALLCKLVRKDA